MKRDIRKLLFDALQACRLIAQFTSGRSFVEYDTDRMLSSAVERQFEIVGEALNQATLLDEGIADIIPIVRQIVGLRNRIIHGYETVSNLLVWRIVLDELPALAEQLDTALHTGE